MDESITLLYDDLIEKVLREFDNAQSSHLKFTSAIEKVDMLNKNYGLMLSLDKITLKNLYVYVLKDFAGRKLATYTFDIKTKERTRSNTKRH